MSTRHTNNINKVALVTGAAKRVGACIARHLHSNGFNLVIHYNRSDIAATELANELNAIRPNSGRIVQADLNIISEVETLANTAASLWGRLDLLVNNASSFYPTPVESSTHQQWDDLINSNVRAAYFLCSALSGQLKRHQGCIINMIDIHAQRGLPGHPIYSIAKAGLQMMTLSLAKELAPKVRVNGVSPGAILWPEADLSEEDKQAILDKTLLKRTGSAEDLAEAVYYLSQAEYITGQIIAVDGGKSLYSH